MRERAWENAFQKPSFLSIPTCTHVRGLSFRSGADLSSHSSIISKLIRQRFSKSFPQFLPPMGEKCEIETRDKGSLLDRKVRKLLTFSVYGGGGVPTPYHNIWEGFSLV